MTPNAEGRVRETSSRDDARQAPTTRPGLDAFPALVLVLAGLALHGPNLAGPFTDGLPGDCGAMFAIMARNTEALGWLGPGLLPAINPVPPAAGTRIDYYSHHPPGLPWLVYAASRLPFAVETAARLVALALTLASVLLLADIAARLAGRRAGWAAGLLALGLPAGWHFGLLVNYETVALPPLLLLIRSLVLGRGRPGLAAAAAGMADWIALAPVVFTPGVPWRRRLEASLVGAVSVAGVFLLGRIMIPGAPAETLEQALDATFLNRDFNLGAWASAVSGFALAAFGWGLGSAALGLLLFPLRGRLLRRVLVVTLLTGLANVGVFAFHATSHETYVLLLLPFVVLSTATLLFPRDVAPRPPAWLGVGLLGVLLAVSATGAREAAPWRTQTSQAELGDAFRAVTLPGAIYLRPSGVPFVFLQRAERVVVPFGFADLASAQLQASEYRKRLGLDERARFVFTVTGDPTPPWVAALGPGDERGLFVFRPLP